jgi:hypothetical protein
MQSPYQQVNVRREVYEALKAESLRTDIPMSRLVKRAWDAYVLVKETEQSFWPLHDPRH